MNTHTSTRIAAIPSYIPSESAAGFIDAAPGHRFMGYLRNTQGPGGELFAPFKGKAKVIATPASDVEKKAANEALKTENDAVLNEVCRLGESAKKQIEAIRKRQHMLTSHHGANVLTFKTQSTAPFATGLGLEHPIENGFAFLTPYGLPYLAGSGVKGILRRAMQELRDEGDAGFTSGAIDSLFGPEKIDEPKDARRGALDFWDVFPKPFGDKLVVEIMTPHFGAYYQGRSTPHDSGAPIPVSFLAVPAKSDFDFHVVCHPVRLPASLQNNWRELLQKAFDHAFAWVGFGAKTSVGYGAMKAATAVSAAISPASQMQGVTGIGLPVPGNVLTGSPQNWPVATLKFNPGKGEITASFDGKTTAPVKGNDADKFRKLLGEELADKLKKKQELKGVSVQVEQQGNSFTLKGVATV